MGAGDYTVDTLFKEPGWSTSAPSVSSVGAGHSADDDDDDKEAPVEPKQRPRAKPKAVKPPRETGLAADPSLPPDCQAVSLGLAVLREAKVSTWCELGPTLERWPSHVVLTEEQLLLLRQHSGLLGLIAWRDGKKPMVTLAICPECHRFEQTTGAWWRKCQLKLHCQGAPVKVSPAKRAPMVTKSAGPEDGGIGELGAHVNAHLPFDATRQPQAATAQPDAA